MDYFTGKRNTRSNSNILDNSNIRTKSPKQALSKIMQLQGIDDKRKVILALKMIVDKMEGNTLNNQPITNEVINRSIVYPNFSVRDPDGLSRGSIDSTNSNGSRDSFGSRGGKNTIKKKSTSTKKPVKKTTTKKSTSTKKPVKKKTTKKSTTTKKPVKKPKKKSSTTK